MTRNNDLIDISKVNAPEYSSKIVIRIDPVLKDYVPQFLAALDHDIIRIIDYLNGKNFQEIQDIAHRLKGEGGTFGFAEAGKLGGLLQTAAVNKNAAEIDYLIKRLTDYLKQIEIVA